jgi:hypothetical protein
VAQHHVAQVDVVIIEQGFAQHGPQVAGVQAELFQIGVVVIHDLRHELVKAHKGQLTGGLGCFFSMDILWYLPSRHGG